MLKKIFVIGLVLSSVSAVAGSYSGPCEGGTLVTAHSSTDTGCSGGMCNGYTFCMSDRPVNWWTAFLWCEANEGKLASLASLCPRAVLPPGSSTQAVECPNLNGVRGSGRTLVWTNISYPTQKRYAYMLNIGDGKLGGFDKDCIPGKYSSVLYAICEGREATGN